MMMRRCGVAGDVGVLWVAITAGIVVVAGLLLVQLPEMLAVELLLGLSLWLPGSQLGSLLGHAAAVAAAADEMQLVVSPFVLLMMLEQRRRMLLNKREFLLTKFVRIFWGLHGCCCSCCPC